MQAIETIVSIQVDMAVLTAIFAIFINGKFMSGAEGRMIVLIVSIFPLLLIATVVCGGQNENKKCDVYPKDPIVSVGDDIQVMFKAPDNSPCGNIPLYDPEKLFWMLNDEKINESLYTIVNLTIPAVVIHNFTLQSGMVTCHMNAGGKSILLGGTNIKVHFPPVKPTNVSCVTVLYTSFTCYWDGGKDASLDTTYTVSRNIDGWIETCRPKLKSSHCSFEKEDILQPTIIWVTARSPLGTTDSDVLLLKDIYSTVKIAPPQMVMAQPLFNSLELKVTWKEPEDSPQDPEIYEVQFTYQQGGSIHKHVRSTIRPELFISVEIQCTRYTISVRAALKNTLTPMWSEWSRDVAVLSPLDVHSIHLHLWRKIHWPDESGNRKIKLMWKGVPTSCDAIDGYRITLKAGMNRTQELLFNSAVTNTFITVDKEAYTIRIVAYRRERILSEDTTTIQAVREVPEFPPVEAAQAYSHNGQINVSWNEPFPVPHTYMVYWFAGDDYFWQETKTTSLAFSGQPLKLYNITVTPLYNKSPGQDTTLLAYSEEGAPGKVSWVTVAEVEMTRALFRWAAVPPDECCGFTVNYTLFYTTPTGPEQSVTVDSTLQEVRLDRLQPGTRYTAHITSSSVAGRTNSSDVVFKTHSKGSLFNILGLFGGIGIILILMTGLCCFIIGKKSVPSPRYSEAVSWPSQYCKRPLLVPYEETCSGKLRISMCDDIIPGPIPTEHAQPVSCDRQPDPASDLGPCGMKCTEELSRSLPYVWECPTPGAWDKATKITPHSQTSGGRGPASPYLKNCVPAVNGRVYPHGEKLPAAPSGKEGRTSADAHQLRCPLALQAYVSADMLQERLFSPV